MAENTQCLENQKFQFTRHLLSCNNIEIGKNLKGKDFEPAITQYGILNSIAFSITNESMFTSAHIIVSNLLRTWLTAFLLYGIHESNELHLYISPYLKEKHGVIKRGNYPKAFSHTASKFIQDINIIKTMLIDSKFPNKVTIHLPPKPGALTPQSLSLIINESGQYFDFLNQLCSIEDTCGPNLTDKLQINQFLETGNLVEFMKWYNSSANYYGKHCSYKGDPENKVVDVVTHSQVMQAYLKEIFNLYINYKKPNAISNAASNAAYAIKSMFGNSQPTQETIELKTTEKFKSVRNSNAWGFNTRENPFETELVDVGVTGFTNNFKGKIPILIPGIPVPDETSAQKIETESPHSLCGTTGSVQNTLICNLPNNADDVPNNADDEVEIIKVNTNPILDQGGKLSRKKRTKQKESRKSKQKESRKSKQKESKHKKHKSHKK